MQTHNTKNCVLCRDFLLLLCVVSAITECLPVVHWAVQLPSGMCLFTHSLPVGRSVCSGVLCFWIFIHRHWHMLLCVLMLEMTRSKNMPCTWSEKWWCLGCSLVNSMRSGFWGIPPWCIRRHCILDLTQHFLILHSLYSPSVFCKELPEASIPFSRWCWELKARKGKRKS